MGRSGWSEEEGKDGRWWVKKVEVDRQRGLIYQISRWVNLVAKGMDPNQQWRGFNCNWIELIRPKIEPRGKGVEF